MMQPCATAIEFFFDPMCPWAYQTSVWIRDVRQQVGLDIDWRFFSLEEVNRPEGKRHPWERPLAYGWTPMRVAAWLRRTDMDALRPMVRGVRPGTARRRPALLRARRGPSICSTRSAHRQTAWEEAHRRPDHARRRPRRPRARRSRYGGFGVPIIVFADRAACSVPSSSRPRPATPALELWDLSPSPTREIPGLFEMKTPKTGGDLRMIANAFEPYLTAVSGQTIQKPAP